MYGLTFGPLEEKIIAAAEERKVDIPITVAEKPEIYPHFQLYWEAFMDLNGTRVSGFGLGPIPWTSIDAFATRHNLHDPEDFQTLKDIVWGVDKAFLEHHEKSKKG